MSANSQLLPTARVPFLGSLLSALTASVAFLRTLRDVLAEAREQERVSYSEYPFIGL